MSIFYSPLEAQLWSRRDLETGVSRGLDWWEGGKGGDSLTCAVVRVIHVTTGILMHKFLGVSQNLQHG